MQLNDSGIIDFHTFVNTISVIYLENGSAYWSVQNVQEP